MGLENSVGPTEPWRQWWEAQVQAISPVSISFGFYLHRVIDVAAHITNVHTFGAKQVAIAGDVAIGNAIMLCMTPSSQGLPAALAPQAGSVPVSAQRHYLLSKIDRFLTARAQ